MRRLLPVITAGFFLSGLISAQDPNRDRTVGDPFFEMLRGELAFRELENSRARIDRELALRDMLSTSKRNL